jgi:hypothetical protein
MKESIDDRITTRIKEVMKQYEPDYSPQAWEKLRKQIPVPEFWLKRVLLKYKFWVSDITIIGVFVLVYNVASVLPEDKKSAVNPMFSETANYTLSEMPKEIAYSEKRSALRQTISDNGINREERNISASFTPGVISDSGQTTGQGYPQTGNSIAEMPESIKINPVIPVSPERTGFVFQENIEQLIPIKYEEEKIPALKSSSSKKSGKSKFQWPELNFIFTNEEGYDKFTGPDKVALFYSPEILHSNSLQNLGISHGIGISFEGAIRSSVSISAGLSYQAINFNKTIIPENVHLYPYVTIIESGNYKYLEVPVSLNFKFFESNRSQLLSGIGISSIVFLKQDYATETVTGDISDLVSSSAKAWENVLPVASLNLSLLYRYQFSDRLFLHSSVLYKNHLVSLGYNSMKLNRLNLQLGLIYSFGHKH